MLSATPGLMGPRNESNDLMLCQISPCDELDVVLVEAQWANQDGLVAKRVAQVFELAWADS